MIAVFTRLAETDGGDLVNPIVRIDRGCDGAANGGRDRRGIQRAHFRDLRHASPCAMDGAICRRRKPRVDFMTGKRQR